MTIENEFLSSRLKDTRSINATEDEKGNENGPYCELGHSHHIRRKITKLELERLALHKYSKTRQGIDFSDVQEYFRCNKSKSQRVLKRACETWFGKDASKHGPILFRSSKRTNPQKFFPSSMRADIIEYFKKRENELIIPTGVNLSRSDILSSATGHQKAQNFLDVLTHLPFAPLHIHRLLLNISVDKWYYHELTNEPAWINRAKRYETNIGPRHIIYTFSPNGRIEIAIRSNTTPFKIETDEDMAILFAFLGQVRDRLILNLNDIRERITPQIPDWVLKGCDLSRDVNIDDKCQMYLPDIQFKYLCQVFRTYIKSLQDRAIYRGEKSLTLNLGLVEALNGIILPMRTINDIKNQVTELSRKFDLAVSNKV
jgi:hypothetical protein